MPDGVVQWFDPVTGDAAVVRGGRVYPATSDDMEPWTRHPGARVHFDVHRDGGVERAAHVEMRPGARTSHRHRDFSTLVGARRPDTKGPAPFARAHPERGSALATHPVEVARAWATCMQVDDLEAALTYFAPAAILHDQGQTAMGRAQLEARLEVSPLLGIGADPDVRGDEDEVLVRWGGTLPGEPGWQVRCRVEHGLIAEGWIDEVEAPAPLPAGDGPGTTQVVVATDGHVGDDDVAYAADRVRAVLSDIEAPVLFARLRLTRATDPARARPAILQAVLDVDGEIVRAHLAGHDMREAADLLQHRLRDQLDHRAERQEALRSSTGVAEPGEWRHGDLPTHRPEHLVRPPEERRLLRHKTFSVGEMTPDEAAFDMEQLDFDFHLFRDLASGEDALLEREPDGGGYRLTRLHPAAVDAGPTAVAVRVVDEHPPTLAVADAIERLDTGGEPFVFFADERSGRGAVVYQRYDGHHGLLTTA